MKYDDAQKTSVRNQLLSRVGGFLHGRPVFHGRWIFDAVNPFRNDKSTGSFKVDSTGKCYDFATKEYYDLIDVYAHVKGMSFKEVMESHGQTIDESDSIPSLAATPKPQTESLEGEPDQRVHLGSPLAFMGHEGLFHYFNRDGQYIGATVRVPEEGLNSKGKPKKAFRVFSSDGHNLHPNASGWKRKPIYGIQNLDRERILIVEGEKCADAAQEVLGESWCVLAWACGTASVLSPNWEPVAMAGKPIYLWPDNDKPGKDAMGTLRVTALAAATLLDVPAEKPEAWDVADAITEGWGKAQLENFITGTAVEEPTEAPPSHGIEPPAVLKPLVDWILQASASAQKHYAIQGAIMLLSALSHGAYSAPTTSVSLYSVLVGGAGAGKNRIIDVVADAVWDLGMQWLSTGEAGSKQAIRSMLHRCSARMIIHGELGNRIADWQSAGGIDKAIGNEILELWAEKSRLEGLQTKESIDPTIERPRLGIFGGVTTSAFREMIGRNRFIEKGWPSRVQFVMAEDVEKLEVTERPKPLEGEILRQLKRIAAKSTDQTAKVNNDEADAPMKIKEKIKVSFSDEASALLKRYQKFCSKREKAYEKAGRNAEHIVSRCAERAQRISSLMAIFSSPDMPVISKQDMEFAIKWEEHVSGAFFDEAMQHGDNSPHERCSISIVNVLKNKGGKLTKRDIKKLSRTVQSVTPEMIKGIYEHMETLGVVKVDKIGKAHVVTLLSDDYQAQKISWDDA